MRRQFATALFERKIFLVIAHDGDQNLIRQRQKSGIEIPGDHGGQFIEVGDHLQQVRVLVNFQAALLGVRGQFRCNLGRALRRTDDHAVGLKFLFVIGEIADGDLVRAEEAVTTSLASGVYAGVREPQRLPVQGGDDPTDGPDEAGAVESRPGHGAGPSQVVDSAGEDFVQYLFRGSPQLDVLGGQVFAPGRLDGVKFLERQSLPFGKTERSPGRRADGVVSHGFRRPSYFAGDVRLLSLQTTQPGNYATRRAEGFDAHAVDEVFCCQ